MTVQDVLQVTLNKVYVMEKDRAYAIIAKFDEGRQDIAVNYDRQAVFKMTVKDITPSDRDLLLTV